ncbi:hypothetical protein SEPCBS119000_002880 [Sporothrix epigloea]|uniref:A-kinase anchor protein 7-like phosphoesterase domain-containing protein n=1 Tax=Sporothrix epigloea TaxID=1892477 RepID=A0ABP0DM53_9PEZI
MPPSKPPPRPQLTHFLCIPLATPSGRPQLADSLATFHADMSTISVSMTSGGGGGPGSASNSNSTTRRGRLPPAALRPVGTLHLTLGVLSLADGDRLEQALQRLQSLTRENGGGVEKNNLAGTPISMALRGLHAMQPPARATVLYASPVDESTGQLAVAGGPLLALCERVRAVFADLLVPDERPLLLHATMVNTIYAQESHGGGRGRENRNGRQGSHSGGRGTRAKLTFDSRDILERYDDFVWMKRMQVQSIALCRMGAHTTTVDNAGNTVDAAYQVEAEINV